jgi:hypothetical protein
MGLPVAMQLTLIGLQRRVNCKTIACRSRYLRRIGAHAVICTWRGRAAARNDKIQANKAGGFWPCGKPPAKEWGAPPNRGNFILADAGPVGLWSTRFPCVVHNPTGRTSSILAAFS